MENVNTVVLQMKLWNCSKCFRSLPCQSHCVVCDMDIQQLPLIKHSSLELLFSKLLFLIFTFVLPMPSPLTFSHDTIFVNYVNKFWLPPLEGGGEPKTFLNGGGSMVREHVFLKGGGGNWHFSYLIFSRFIIFTFRNYFTLCKIVLCYAFEEKLFFSATIILWKKITLICLKMNLKISHKLW